MNVHEYQAKRLLSEFGVAVPRGTVVSGPGEVAGALGDLRAERYVVKAQIHAGGRGKAGGVRVVNGPAEAAAAAGDMIGTNLVTRQTGPGGKTVGKVLVEEASDIEKEFYLGMVIDRSEERVVVMASPEGGVEIEEVAAESPGKIMKEHVDLSLGAADYAGGKSHGNVPAEAVDGFARELLEPFGNESGENPYVLQQDLQDVMQRYIGVFRTRENIEKGIEEIEKLKERSRTLKIEGSVMFNPGWHLCRDLKSMLTVSEALARCALEREESRGAHSRVDFPESDDSGWGRVNSVVSRKGDSMEVGTRSIGEMPEELSKLFTEGE